MQWWQVLVYRANDLLISMGPGDLEDAWMSFQAATAGDFLWAAFDVVRDDLLSMRRFDNLYAHLQ